MSNYTITYTVTVDIDRFEFWSGAKSRMDNATDEQREEVYRRIAEYCEYAEDVSEGSINDLVWFDCDDIFFPEETEETA